MIYRKMASGEEDPVLELVMRVFDDSVRSELGEAGAAVFERTARSVIHTPTPLHSILVAEEEGRLVGVLATRSDGHISLFFVDPEYQRAGVGRRLCEVALARAHDAGRRPTTITVNATPSAVRVYESLGFRVVDLGGREPGARFVPMALSLTPPGTTGFRRTRASEE